MAQTLGSDDVLVGLAMIQNRIAALLEDGKAEFLGPEYTHALKRVRADAFGTIGNGPPIDLNKLHRSDKIKSGFVGVYPNGKGFRAEGRLKNRTQTKYLGTFDTAEEAAWIRYLYYKTEGIPYGPMEERILELRTKWKMSGTDAELEADQRAYDRSVGLETLAPGEESENAYNPEDPNGDVAAAEAEAANPKLKAMREEMQRAQQSSGDVPMLGFEGGLPADVEVALRRADK